MREPLAFACIGYLAARLVPSRYTSPARLCHRRTEENPAKNLAAFNIAPSVPRALWHPVTRPRPYLSRFMKGVSGKETNNACNAGVPMKREQDWASKRRTPWALETEWRNLS